MVCNYQIKVVEFYNKNYYLKWTSKQVFTIYVLGYERARNVHVKGVTRARKFVHCIRPRFKNNLNLPICCFFFFISSVLSSLLLFFVVLLCLLPRCTALIFLFACFYGSQFLVQPKTRYFLVNIKTGFHLSYFENGKNIIEQGRGSYV